MSYDEYHRRVNEEYHRLTRLKIDETTVLHFNVGEIYLDGPYCDWYRPASTYSIKDGKLVSYILKPEGYVEASFREDYAPLTELLPSDYNDQIEHMKAGGLDYDAAISYLVNLDEIADKIRYDSLYVPAQDF